MHVDRTAVIGDNACKTGVGQGSVPCPWIRSYDQTPAWRPLMQGGVASGLMMSHVRRHFAAAADTELTKNTVNRRAI